MRRMICALLVAHCAGAGCTTLPKLWEKPKPPPPVVQAPNPAPPVTAAQINERNAGQMAGALAREIEQDSSANTIQQTNYSNAEPAPCKH